MKLLTLLYYDLKISPFFFFPVGSFLFEISKEEEEWKMRDKNDEEDNK